MSRLSTLSDTGEMVPLRKYGLVCGLQFERFYSREITFLKGTVNPLFRLFPDSQIAWAGPWLIDTEKSQELNEQLTNLAQHAPAVSWISSPVDIDTLTRMLASQLHVSLENGERGVFRFYDPRVLKKTPAILTAAQFSDFTQGIESWIFKVDGTLYDLLKMGR